jgi:hypothetical protein
MVLHGITTYFSGYKRDDHKDHQQPVKQPRREIPDHDDPGRPFRVFLGQFDIFHICRLPWVFSEKNLKKTLIA